MEDFLPATPAAGENRRAIYPSLSQSLESHRKRSIWSGRFEMNCFLKCFLLATGLLLVAVARTTAAADTNSLVWRAATDRVSADVHGEPLLPLLEDIAHQTGWHIFVEPAT